MRAHLRVLHQLLESQGGVASLEQLRRLGLDEGRVNHLRRSGTLTSIYQGVYRGAGVPESWLTRLVGSTLFLGGRAIASLATAARLHSLPGFEDHDTVEFTRVSESRGIGGRVTVHTSRRLDEVDRSRVPVPGFEGLRIPSALRDVTLVRSIDVTTPTRTVIDLASRLRVPTLARLVDSAVSLRKTSVDLLVERLESLRDCGVSGVRRMDQVLIDSGVESWLERRFLELLREAGLPRPRCQVVFRDGSKIVARVDFLFDGTNVVVEVSGRRGHVTDAERQKDARRRNDLQRAGVLVIEFVTSDIMHEPGYVIATLRRVLSLD
ncbi:MAG: type IV toxin-antitoxin system AbiEi family antitoxin domain-containing protein [Ilumatobacteraceae bacterium]